MSSGESEVAVETFFDAYRAAFARFDASSIARLFASTVHVASDAGSTVHLKSFTEVEWGETIEQIVAMYHTMGVGAIYVNTLTSEAISSQIVLVRAAWRLHDRTGSPLYEFTALYTLVRHEESFRIAALAHDEMTQSRHWRGTHPR